MGDGEIPSFLICLPFHFGNQSEAIRNHSSKKLDQSNMAWLQCLRICTFPYDFTVRYIKGSTNQLADCLSRLGCQKDKIELPKLKIHAITRQLPATSDWLNQFHTETAQDEEMALLKYTVQTGWPHKIHDVLKEIQPYWTFQEHIMIEDGLLLKGTHIIVPQTLHGKRWSSFYTLDTSD